MEKITDINPNEDIKREARFIEVATKYLKEIDFKEPSVYDGEMLRSEDEINKCISAEKADDKKRLAAEMKIKTLKDKVLEKKGKRKGGDKKENKDIGENDNKKEINVKKEANEKKKKKPMVVNRKRKIINRKNIKNQKKR
ncbi:hypothetical protein TCON_0584 [Astathelohania contejeani]|uniref:Uncharacterized protein n=1 Tax=Astathelohania contejeani TaxID=164912 RepID=A0ABQ7I1C6_9MICR|nr:hypothetical protein TCON_0584 [Thelohania contejeani]